MRSRSSPHAQFGESLRIAVITAGVTAPPRDGVSSFIASSLKILASLGHTPVLVALRDPSTDGHVADHYEAVEFRERWVAMPGPGVMRAMGRRTRSIFSPIPAWQSIWAQGWLQKWVQGSTEELEAELVIAMGIGASVASRSIAQPSGLVLFGLPFEDAAMARVDRISRLSTRWMEGKELYRHEAIAAVNPEEAQLLQNRWQGINPLVLPLVAGAPGFARGSSEPKVLFVGDWNYSPNREGLVTFLRQAMSEVWTVHPSAKLVLAGKASFEVAFASRCDSRVVVAGEYEYLADLAGDVTVAVLPLVSSSGIRTRVIEILANGIPLVATRTATQGFELGQDECRLVSSVHEMADAVSDLLGSAELRGSMRQAGLRFVEGQASPHAAREQWASFIRVIHPRTDKSYV